MDEVAPLQGGFLLDGGVSQLSDVVLGCCFYT